MTVGEAIKLALEHQNAGRLHDAELLYRQVLNVAPDHPEALHWLGVIAMRSGANELAQQLIARAIERSPEYAEAHCSMGDLKAGLGSPQEAAEAYRRAVVIRPAFVEAWNNLGTVLADLGRTEDAIDAYTKARQLQPDSPQPWCNLSQAMLNLDRWDEALDYARESLARDAQFPDAHNNAGAALLRKGRLEEALSSLQRAIELRPEFPLARANLGMVLLLKGDLAGGFREYEWRLRLTDSIKLFPGLKQPRWGGEELGGGSTGLTAGGSTALTAGKRIFLHAEQGLGDLIHFARYIPLVAARGGSVIVGCPAPLKRLMSRMPGVVECITPDDSLSPFDVQCPFPSLPAAFGTTLETIPANIPYIRPDPSLAGPWQDRLRDERRMKVGLVWAGNPANTNDRNRSMLLSALSPLAQVDGIRWISLQKGGPADQARNPPAGMELTDWTDDLRDFDDTAALIDSLDLVIAVDTSVAHLAAAMGKPVWLLLCFAAHWAWMLDREDTPWYPTMRLFRQTTAGDWAAPVRRAAQALQETTSQELPPAPRAGGPGTVR